MNARTRAVQTPGAPTAEPAADTNTTDQTVAVEPVQADAVDQSNAPADTAAAGDTVAVPKEDLAALLAEVRSLKDQVRVMQSNPANATRRLVNPEAVLPDQSEIDPNTIKTPQLSKQGWVVPTGFGANPAQKGL